MTENIKPDVVKHKSDLIKQHSTSDDYIASIPTELVYEWVKNGKWKYKDFKRWLKVMRVVE